jgi:hypothetical protein
VQKISYDEYKTMCDALGRNLSDRLHTAVQNAFGTVCNVKSYHQSGLVVFVDGQKWIFNFSKLYPTFYRVDIKCDELKKAY